jgi:hypothetical protein
MTDAVTWDICLRRIVKALKLPKQQRDHFLLEFPDVWRSHIRLYLRLDDDEIVESILCGVLSKLLYRYVIGRGLIRLDNESVWYLSPKSLDRIIVKHIDEECSKYVACGMWCITAISDGNSVMFLAME